MKIDKNIKLKLILNDKIRRVLDKATKDSKKIKSLTAKIEATHSGIINKNKWFYTPTGMRDGTSSFVEPFNKPVLTNHDSEGDALGRVVDAEYISYNDVEEVGLVDTIDTASYFKKIKTFIDSEMFNDKDYKGLGHISLTVEITDEEAIDKLLDGRYLTVSIGGDTEQAVCSICGQDKKNVEDSEDSCEHWRGEVYDGEEAFMIGGKMSFSEVSFVNSPADENAKVKLLKDSLSIEDNTKLQELEILDFIIENTGDDKLKIKLSDLALSDKLKSLLENAFKSLKLDDQTSSDDELKSLRKTSFLFSDERALPLHSKGYILAAYKVLESVEDSEDKEQAVSVIDSKFKKEFGDLSVEDALASLKVEDKSEGDVEDDNKDIDSQSAIDYDEIATKFADKIKDLIGIDDSFLVKRNASLEDEIAALETENKDLSDLMKSTVILQILQAEDKLTDVDYKKLEGRTLDSLKDKLNDLLDVDTESNEDDKSEDEGNDVEDNFENNSDKDDDGISDSEAGISDAVEDEGEVEDSDADDNDLEGKDQLSVDEIRDKYKKLIRTKGMRAASDYLADLREDKTLPANFTFSR